MFTLQTPFQRQPVYKLVHLCPGCKKKKGIAGIPFLIKIMHLAWLRGRDLNPRPLGYEPNGAAAVSRASPCFGGRNEKASVVTASRPPAILRVV